MCTRLHTKDFHWIHGRIPKGIVPGGKKRAFVQLRHRMEAVSGVLSHDWDAKGSVHYRCIAGPLADASKG